MNIRRYILIGFMLVVIIILLVIWGITEHDLKRCGGIYPNPEIAMCGVYSQKDFDKIACEDFGGLYVRGNKFSSGNCILK